jgi:hypothetical protein
MTIDLSTLLPVIILGAGLIYETCTWIYRKVQNNEPFDLGKYALTFGYVGLVAVGSYIVTGILPGVSDVMNQLGTSVPDATAIMGAASTVIIGISHQLIKNSPAAGAVAATATAAAPVKQTVAAMTASGSAAASTPAAAPTGATGAWSPDFSIVPTSLIVKSGTPVTLTLTTQMIKPTTGPHRPKEIDIDWMDGSPIEVFPAQASGVQQVTHVYNYSQGNSAYYAHQFYPEFTLVDAADGSQVSFNTEGRDCAIEVQSLVTGTKPMPAGQ